MLGQPLRYDGMTELCLEWVFLSLSRRWNKEKKKEERRKNEEEKEEEDDFIFWVASIKKNRESREKDHPHCC